MTDNWKLYQLVNPIDNTVFYIGITCRELKDRVKDHYKTGLHQFKTNSQKTQIVYDLKKQNKKPIISLLFDEMTKKEAEYLEKEAILAFRAAGFPLTNISLGGGVYVPTKQDIEKAKESRRKNPWKPTEKQLAKLSKAIKGENNGMYGRKHSPETKLKMSEIAKKRNNRHWLGRKHTEETKHRLSEIRKGKKPNIQFSKSWKQIIVTNLKNNEEKLFNTITEAANFYGCGSDNICIVLKGKGKTFLNKQYTARYKE